MSGFEILEHTADVGIRAVGTTPEEVVEQATRGVADITGIWAGEAGEETEILLEGDDRAALLVDWLSEVLWLHDSRDALLGKVRVDEANPKRIRGMIALVPRGTRDVEGTQVKAITYHRLRFEPRGDGWIAEVYVDV